VPEEVRNMIPAPDFVR